MGGLTLPQLERHLFVVVHELVHLREPHHSPGFWRAVERVLPDFELRRQWLAEHGAEVGAL